MPTWSLWRRVAFRFAFVYLALYMLPFPLNWIPIASRDGDSRYVMFAS